MRNDKLRKVLKEIIITLFITIILALMSINIECTESVFIIATDNIKSDIENKKIDIINPYNINPYYIKQYNANKSRINLNEEDRALLYTVIYLEMGSENLSKESRLVIGSTIINRVLNSKFGDTLYDVIYTKNQYSVVSKMNNNLEYKNNIYYYSDYLCSKGYYDLDSEIWSIVDMVCNKDYSNGGLYFCEYSSVSNSNKKWFDSLDFIGEWHGVRVYK